MLWWTPREKMNEYMSLHACHAMQCTAMSWEHTLQPPFDINTMNIQGETTTVSKRLKVIDDAIQTCDRLHDDVLQINLTLAYEKRTPGLLTRLKDLSSHLANLRHFTATPVEAPPAKRQRASTTTTGPTTDTEHMRTLLRKMNDLNAQTRLT